MTACRLDRGCGDDPCVCQPAEPYYVLAYASGGRVTYFQQWTAIGPCGTWDKAEAARFDTMEAALLSPAYSFPLTLYRPQRIAPA